MLCVCLESTFLLKHSALSSLMTILVDGKEASDLAVESLAFPGPSVGLAQCCFPCSLGLQPI